MEEYPYQGSSNTLINGEPIDFKLKASHFAAGFFGIGMEYSEGDLVRLAIDFIRIPDSLGTYALNSDFMGTGPQSFLFTSFGDHSKDDYNLLTGATNELTITKIDNARSEISGTYSLIFVRDTLLGPKEDIFPDTLQLVAGKFTTQFARK